MNNNELLQELLAMREIGIYVSDGTLNHARLDDLSEYGGISYAELADLFCSLYNVAPAATSCHPDYEEKL